MIQGLNESHLTIIRSWAAEVQTVEKVFVFGSRAKWIARSDSDLDLAVVTKHEKHHSGAVFVVTLESEEKAALRKALSLPFEVQVEVTHPIAGDETVWPAVENHGVLIYELECS